MSKQYEQLERCITFIEDGIARGKSYSEISKGLEIEFGSRYGTLRNNFNSKSGISLGKYIKRRMLTEGYLRFLKEQPVLTVRSQYAGIDRFSTKFKDAFGQDVSGSYTIDDLQAPLTIKDIKETEYWAKHHAEMMLAMTRAQKLTIEDMDYIMGFRSERERDAAHAAFGSLLEEHPRAQMSLLIADRLQRFIDQTRRTEYAEREN